MGLGDQEEMRDPEETNDKYRLVDLAYGKYSVVDLA